MRTQTQNLIQITILLRLLAKIPTTNAIEAVEPVEAACCWPYDLQRRYPAYSMVRIWRYDTTPLTEIFSLTSFSLQYVWMRV
ncbi:hypothetical protein HYALB_00012075 [Hymenoscyphus albidus]|uniref:Secreted protein n=1 Tax=Hymenoscyphus albidus TaxID=595503 RepID=A0A9N9LQI5_9HELO|nr:hypothetical protein HYALB_00012075 [Hymenoscyphus albidus]